MKCAAIHYVRINGTVFSRGEIIPGELLTDDERNRLLRLEAIAIVDGDEIMPAPEVSQEDDVPEIDVMAGLVTEPEKPPVKKTSGRSRKK